MKKYLKSLIKLQGPLTVSQFMNEALFHPKLGYYTNNQPIGRDGDFITAPEISQVFGELIAAYNIDLWQNNYNSQEINLVEMGAGKGTLMHDILRFASKIPNFLEKVTINIIEISPKLQEIQKNNLKNFKIKWWNNFDDFYENNQQKPIFFLANELFDCFAINQYVRIDNIWVEKMVNIDKNDDLKFALSEKNEILSQKIEEFTQKDIKNGDIFEYSPLSSQFMSDLSSAIKKTNGLAIIIDYGYIENKYKDSLQAIYKHKYSDLLQNIGKSDITSLVNFTNLEKIANNLQLKSWIVTQKEFLESLGIEIRRKSLINSFKSSKAKSSDEQENINSAIDRLINKDQMGELFKVMILSD